MDAQKEKILGTALPGFIFENNNQLILIDFEVSNFSL